MTPVGPHTVIDGPADAAHFAKQDEEKVRDHVVVCLGGLSAHVNGSPIFSCLVYGPFTAEEVGEKAREIMRIEGSATFVRPLVDLNDTYRRMSAD